MPYAGFDDGEGDDAYSSPGVIPPTQLPVAPVIIAIPGVIVSPTYLAKIVPFNSSRP